MSKYNAKPVVIDGIRFDSQAEARHYAELRLLERAGQIRGLEVHPRYCLAPKETLASGEKLRAIWYVADFQYISGERVIVVDVKGVRTPVYRLKLNLFRRAHPRFEFREVEA